VGAKLGVDVVAVSRWYSRMRNGSGLSECVRGPVIDVAQSVGR
jgi:hypothetical protein